MPKVPGIAKEGEPADAYCAKDRRECALGLFGLRWAEGVAPGHTMKLRVSVFLSDDDVIRPPPLETPNPKLHTPNPEPQTPNPKP